MLDKFVEFHCVCTYSSVVTELWPCPCVQMTFDDNQFSVVLDKGTIDALMSNKSEQVGLAMVDRPHTRGSLRLGSVRYRSDSSTDRSRSPCHRPLHMYHTSSEAYSRARFAAFLQEQVSGQRTRPSVHSSNNRSWLLRYHHVQTSKSFALPVFAFVFTKITMKTPVGRPNWILDELRTSVVVVDRNSTVQQHRH